MFERFKRRPEVPKALVRRPKKEKCRIKFKKTKDGGDMIEFDGNCTPDQIEVAKGERLNRMGESQRNG